MSRIAGKAAEISGSGLASEGAELAARIARLPYWYHRIELPHGIVTPGWAPLRIDAYRVPERLDGKRVLDIGAWDGFWAFEALKRGARQVVAIDDFSDFLGSLKQQDRRAWENFDLCREALGYSAGQCQRHEMSIYDLKPETFGKFDYVFAFGLLYHLRYPLLALDRISAVCEDRLYVGSAILDDFSPYRGGIRQGYSGGQMLMEFYPEDQYGGNATNCWVPTLHCLAHMVRSAGFEHADGWKLTGNPARLAECRGFACGYKQLPERAEEARPA